MKNALEISLDLMSQTPADQLPQLIARIDDHLINLTTEIFDELGDKLNIYGDKLNELIAKTSNRDLKTIYEARLELFYAKLRSITKLSHDRDITVLEHIWQDILIIPLEFTIDKSNF